MPLQAIRPSISRNATVVVRVLAVLFAVSLLPTVSAREAEDPADRLRPAVKNPRLSEQDIQNNSHAEQLRPVAEELSRAVENLSKPGTSAEEKAKAAETIGRLGHDIQYQGRHILIQALQSRREVVRIKAARTLRESGPTVAFYAVRFDWLLRDHKAHLDPSPAVRAEIIEVMVLAGRGSPEQVLPALWQMIREDKRLDLRLRAAAALVRIILGLGPAPADGPVEDLIPQHAVQKYATFVSVVRESSKFLHAALKDPDEQVRFKALKSLNEMGRTQVSVQQLLDALKEKNPAMRVEAVTALGGLNRQRPRLVEPVLIRALKDESKEVRVRAVWAVSWVSPVDMSGVRVLIEALKEKDVQDNVGVSVCRSAAWALARMGPTAAREAIPAVVEWFDSNDPRLRSDAFRILDAVGSADERVAPILRKLLRRKEKAVRVAAAVYLSKLGRADDKECLPILLEGLDISEIKDQSMGSEADGRLLFVVRALGEMGPYAEEAAPKLRAILNDPKRQVVHTEVKKALQNIRP